MVKKRDKPLNTSQVVVDRTEKMLETRWLMCPLDPPHCSTEPPPELLTQGDTCGHCPIGQGSDRHRWGPTSRPCAWMCTRTSDSCPTASSGANTTSTHLKSEWGECRAKRAPFFGTNKTLKWEPIFLLWSCSSVNSLTNYNCCLNCLKDTIEFVMEWGGGVTLGGACGFLF